MQHSQAQSPEMRPLHRRDVLWALSIIVGLTVAPAVSDLYAVYFM